MNAHSFVFVRTLQSLIPALALAVVCPSAHANTHVWKGGGGDTLWSNPANWSSGGIPEDDDNPPINLVFPSNASSFHSTCDTSFFEIDAMTIRGNYTFSHTDNGDDNLVILRNNAADNIIMDSATPRTVTFDSSFFLDMTGSGKGRIRMTSGSLHFAGAYYGSVVIDGSGDVFAEGGRGFSGYFEVNGPTLHLNTTPGTAAIQKVAVTQPGAVSIEKDNQLRGAEIFLDGAVMTLMASVGDWVGPTRLTLGGSINAFNSGASLLFTDDFMASDGSNFLFGNFALGGVTRTFFVPADDATLTMAGSFTDGTTTVNGQVKQTGGIQKTGGGTLRFTGSGTYKGPLKINEGTFSAESSTAFGATSGGVTVANGAKLILKGITIGDEGLDLAGKLEVPTGTNSWDGDIVLESTAQPIDVDSSPTQASLKFSGIVSGPGTLILQAGGVLELAGSGSNTYTGETVNRTGAMHLHKTSGNAIPGPLTITAYDYNFETRVVLDADNQIADSATVLLNGEVATLDLNSHSETIGALWSIDATPGPGGGLSGGGQVKMGSSLIANTTFTVGANNISTTFDGVISGTNGMTFVKTGTGTLQFNYHPGGANTYTGPTRVQGGTLMVNQYQKAGAVTVKTGGTLGGTGIVGTVSADGGNVCACQLTTGPVTATTNGGWVVAKVAGPSPGPNGYDQLHVVGPLNLAFTVLSASLTYQPATGAQFVIIANDGADPIQGAFFGLAEGAALTVSGKPFTITYKGGDGNDVALNYGGWGGGPPLITSLSYDKATDTIHLRGLAKPGVVHQWQFGAGLKSWATIWTGTPDSAGRINLDQVVGLHADHLFFRLIQP